MSRRKKNASSPNNPNSYTMHTGAEGLSSPDNTQSYVVHQRKGNKEVITVPDYLKGLGKDDVGALWGRQTRREPVKTSNSGIGIGIDPSPSSGSGYGVDPAATKKDDGVTGFLKSMFGSSSSTKQTPTSKGIQKTDAGIGVGNVGKRIIPDANDTVRSIYGKIFADKQAAANPSTQAATANVAANNIATLSSKPKVYPSLNAAEEGVGIGFAPSETQISANDWAVWSEIANKNTLTKEDEQAARLAAKKIEAAYPAITAEGMAPVTVPKEVRQLYATLSNRSSELAGFGSGLLDSLGINWLMDRFTPYLEKADGADAGSYSMQKATDQASADHPMASMAGNIAGTLMLASGAQAATQGITKAATGAIKGLSALPRWVQSAISGAIQSGFTFGSVGAYQGITNTQTKAEWDRQENEKAADYAAQGIKYEPIEYSAGKQALDVLKQAGINAIGGVAGSATLSAIGTTSAYVLVKAGLQTPFMEALRLTLMGTGFAGGRILGTYWLYPKDARPSKQQIVQDIAVSMVFSAINSYSETAKITKSNYAYLQNGVEQMKAQYAETLSGAKTVAEKVQAYENILQINKDLRSAMAQNYYAGQQEGVNDILKALDAVDEQIGINMMAAEAARATNATGTAALPGTESAISAPLSSNPTAPAPITPATAAPALTPQQAAIGTQLSEIGVQAEKITEIQTAVGQLEQRPEAASTIRNFQATLASVQLGMRSATTEKAAADVKVTTALQEKWNAAKAAGQEAENAMLSGDFKAHKALVQKAYAAFDAYNGAYAVAKAESQARAAKFELETANQRDRVMQSYEQMQTAAAQAAPAKASVSPVAQPQATSMESMPAADLTTQAAAPSAQAASETQSAPADVMTAIDDLRGVASGASYRSTLEKHGLSGLMLSGSRDASGALIQSDNDQSILEFVYQNSSVQDGFTDGWIIPSYNDAKISELESWSRFYDVSNVDPNSNAPVQIVQPARMTNRPTSAGVSQTNNFFTLVEKGIMSNTGLTAQPVTGNVSATGKTASGVPVYRQQSTTNGGNPNGNEGQDTQLREQALSGLQQNEAGDRPGALGQNEAYALANGAAGRGEGAYAAGQSDSERRQGIGGGSQGDLGGDGYDQGTGVDRGGRQGLQEAQRSIDDSGRLDQKRPGLRYEGPTQRIGADWKKFNLRALEGNIADFNAEIAETGSKIPPIEPGDLVPIQDIDTETAKMLHDLSRFSGREVFLYVSKSGRTDLPGGFADGVHDYVRYTGEDTVVFHNAHETAENSRKLRQAGFDALKLCPPETLDRYIALRAANGGDVSPKEKTKLKKEFVCDMYGAYMYSWRVGGNVDIYKQLGVGSDVVTRFEDAFMAVTNGEALEETDLDEAMDEANQIAGTGFERSESRIRGGRHNNSDLLQAGASTESGINTVRSSVATDIVTTLAEKIKPSTENSQFLIKGGSVLGNDPKDAIALEEAVGRHMNDDVALRYAQSPDADPLVAGYMRGMERADYNARVIRTAMDLFDQGETPESYWQKNPKAYDNAVGRQLLGIMQRNGQATGGRLPQAAMDWLTRDALKFPQFSNARLSISAPARILENLGRTRSNNTPENRTNNYLDGVQLRDAIFGFADHMNGVSAVYERTEHNKVMRAFGEGTKRESALIDLLGQRYITEDDARSAVFDANHMIVPSQNALYVFGGSALNLMSDDQQTILFDQKYKDALRAKNEELRKAMMDAKSQNEYKRIIEKFQSAVKNIPKVVMPGKARVVVNGKTLEVYLPDGNLYARVQNGKHADMKIVNDTTAALKDYYARAYQQQNLALVSNGYPAMGLIADYFPHRLPETGTLKGFTKFITSEDLPTWINGTTATRKPGRPYTSHVLERMGTYTNFDAIANFNVYLPSASDLIHMTPVIQRVRQFERELRQLSKFESENGTQGARSANSSLAVFLMDYGNLFANKKPLIDRGAEMMFGRKFYKVQDFVTNMYGASAVAGNISVALSNIIAGFEAVPTLNKTLMVKNFVITIGQGFRLAGDNISFRPDALYDGFANEIPFLASRRNELNAILTKEEHWQHIKRGSQAVASALFDIFDYLSTETVARTKFDMLMREGLTKEEAIRETSAYCHKLFASRATGMSPMIFKSRMMRPFLQFLLEPVNQVGHIRDITWETRRDAVQDIEQMIQKADPKMNLDEEIKKAFRGTGWKNLARILVYLVCTSLYNMFVSRPLKGRDSTYNAFGLGYDFVYDLEHDGIDKALAHAGSTFIDQSPIGGFVGGGRIPVGGILDNATELAQELTDKESTPEDRWKVFWKNVYGIAPGGAQISKTVRGREANMKGGSYTESGKLRYPVTEPDFWRTFVFGPSAAEPYGYDYLTDTLSESKTGAYEQLVKDGMDPYKAYYMLQNYDASSNATKALSILTADNSGGHIGFIDKIMGVKSKPDGKPDFSPKEAAYIASVMGMKYDPKKNGSFTAYAKAAADDYIEKAQKDGVTKDEQKTIDSIKRMMQLMLGN